MKPTSCQRGKKCHFWLSRKVGQGSWDPSRHKIHVVQRQQWRENRERLSLFSLVPAFQSTGVRKTEDKRVKKIKVEHLQMNPPALITFLKSVLLPSITSLHTGNNTDLTGYFWQAHGQRKVFVTNDFNALRKVILDLCYAIYLAV